MRSEDKYITLAFPEMFIEDLVKVSGLSKSQLSKEAGYADCWLNNLVYNNGRIYEPTFRGWCMMYGLNQSKYVLKPKQDEEIPPEGNYPYDLETIQRTLASINKTMFEILKEIRCLGKHSEKVEETLFERMADIQNDIRGTHERKVY